MVPRTTFAAAVPLPWCLLVGGLVGLLWAAGQLLNRLWWQPRRLERVLRAQGLRGTSYRFLTGDLKDLARMNQEAWSRPLPLRCHDIAPRVIPFFYNNMREHGKTSLSWFGPIPKVIIADPELAKDVMSNKFGHFGKPRFPALFKLLSDGVASKDGETWVKRRRILNPGFHLEKLKRMLPAFSVCCEEVVSRWVEFAGSDGSCELDVWPELQNLTGDVISRTAFSSSYLEGRRIFQLQAEQAKRVMKSFQKITIPGYMLLPTENNRKMHRINKEIETILRGLIEKRIQAMKEGESKDDLLGLLLESNIRDPDGSSKSGMAMTIEDIMGECKLFYFAGMETTSILLTWTMVVLSMHPEWQDRAREEVTMILYEVLRLYPPGIKLSRKAYEDVELGGIVYPAGVIIEISVLMIHHDPDIWGSDVHEFKPDRPEATGRQHKAMVVLGASFATAASVPWSFLLCGLLGLALLWQAGRLLNQLWWRPRRLERALRAQGIPGTSYKFLTGDLKEYGRLAKQAWSKPLPLGCHDIAHRVTPFVHNLVQVHGKMSMSWFGPNPKVTIVDPELSKDVLSNKFGHFEKLKFQALSKMLGDGVASHEGEKWVKHRRILNPAFHLEKLKVNKFNKSLPTRSNRKMRKNNKEVESILRDIIGKRIQAMKQGESTKDDLLGLLLESNMRETEENGQSSTGMTIADVIEECKVFYFAGMETTSVLLTWTIVVLSMHPEWQNRAREEVLGLFGKNKPEYEGLSRLKIVTMILYEVLRLYPPAISFVRKTYKEMEIGGITYPAGVILELPVLFIHHDPDIWGSDVHEFKPDRFSEGISKASKDPGAFLPFGWGPRICIGQNFALLEAKMALCMILQRFVFELAPSYTHAPHTVITLHPMHGAQIKLRSV
nr:unnamed protein product [Digitaria exilis]